MDAMALWYNDSEYGESTMSAVDSEAVTVVYGPLVTCLRTVFIVATALVSILGNLFSLAVMRSVQSPRFPPSTKVFLSHVIAADLAYGLWSALFVGPAALNGWPYGQLACHVTSFLDAWLCSCCVNAAIFITVDRVVAVIHPLRHGVMISRKRAIVMLLAAALFSLVFTLVVFWGVEVFYNNNAVMCLVHWSMGKQSYLVRLSILACYSCFIPCFILIACYAKLYQIARRQANRHAIFRGKKGAPTRGERTRPNARVRADRNYRALRMCALITVTFCAAWTPYVAVSYRNYFVGAEAPPLVDFVMNWLCVSNSWWDVIVYFFMAEGFRKTALRLFRRRRREKATAKIRNARSALTKEN